MINNLPNCTVIRRKIMDFIQWCQAKGFSVPTTDENTTRSGIRGQYPDAYVRSQYPDGYFAPTSATWKLDLANASKKKMVKGAE
jgi:hypothetical protein